MGINSGSWRVLLELSWTLEGYSGLGQLYEPSDNFRMRTRKCPTGVSGSRMNKSAERGLLFTSHLSPGDHCPHLSPAVAQSIDLVSIVANTVNTPRLAPLKPWCHLPSQLIILAPRALCRHSEYPDGFPVLRQLLQQSQVDCPPLSDLLINTLCNPRLVHRQS